MLHIININCQCGSRNLEIRQIDHQSRLTTKIDDWRLLGLHFVGML